jgi:hypothetical protein
MPVPSARLDASFQIVDARQATANFSGKQIRNRQERYALVTQEREKEKLHRSTSEIPLAGCVACLSGLFVFKHANGAKDQRKRQFCIEMSSNLR